MLVGGEGMSSGLRDAHQLAWRIALVQNMPELPESAVTCLLDGWEAERRRGIRDAITFTKINGMLCNEPESWGFFVYRHLAYMYRLLPLSLQSTHARTVREAKGFKTVGNGFFLSQFSGGGKLAQVFVDSNRRQSFRSDELLSQCHSLFTLLVIGPNAEARCVEITSMLDRVHLPLIVLSGKAIISLDQVAQTKSKNDGGKQSCCESFRPTYHTTQDIVGDVSNYIPSAYLSRLGSATMYAVLRPDFYIFALLKDIFELEQCLAELKRMLD